MVEIDKLAEKLAKAIQRGPPRNPSWEICRSDKFETNAAEFLEHLKASDEESWGGLEVVSYQHYHKVFTFYSYKGGVGRSMALANAAVLLSERGRNVLIVDFDLEAPGLERYFQGKASIQIRKSAGGVIDLLLDALEGRELEWRKYINQISSKNGWRLNLLVVKIRRTSPSQTATFPSF